MRDRVTEELVVRDKPAGIPIGFDGSQAQNDHCVIAIN
jgi:hypothetical protein